MASRSGFRTFLVKPLAAGVAGGLVVALLGLGAIRAGWLDVEEGSAAPVRAQGAQSNTSARSMNAGSIYRRASDSVAFIEAGPASGSGFLMDEEGRVVTNAHVVEGSDAVTVTLGEDGEPLEAEVLGLDTSTDIAVLEVDPTALDVEPLPLGDSSEIAVGDAVVAIGNPFGLDRTVTTGIVSALQRQISAPDGFTISDVIQTDAAINPGNSGGPLFNADGEVIGINSQIATAGGQGSVGVGFAVPVNTARSVAGQILDDGTADHAFIGITGADAESGALVRDVTAGGPADLAGLQPGRDVIVAAGGEAVSGMEDLIAIVNTRQPGEEIELEVERDGERRSVTVELGARPTGGDPEVTQPG